MQLCVNPLLRIIFLCAGYFLATAKQPMMEGNKKDRPGSVPLPATTAATAETARKEASRVIGEVLQQAGTSRSAPTSDNMETSQSGSASIPYRNFHSEGAADGAYPPPPQSLGVANLSEFRDRSAASTPPPGPDQLWTNSDVAASKTTAVPTIPRPSPRRTRPSC